MFNIKIVVKSTILIIKISDYKNFFWFYFYKKNITKKLNI